MQGHFEQEIGDVWPRKRPLPAALMFPCSVCPIWQLPLFGGSAISMYTIRDNTAERELALTAIRVGAVSALNDVLLSAASGRGAMDLTPCAGGGPPMGVRRPTHVREAATPCEGGGHPM